MSVSGRPLVQQWAALLTSLAMEEVSTQIRLSCAWILIDTASCNWGGATGWGQRMGRRPILGYTEAVDIQSSRVRYSRRRTRTQRGGAQRLRRAVRARAVKPSWGLTVCTAIARGTAVHGVQLGVTTRAATEGSDVIVHATRCSSKVWLKWGGPPCWRLWMPGN